MGRSPTCSASASRPGAWSRWCFSVERKSQLGFGLLAAVHSGQLRLYRSDGSSEAAECRTQLARARAAYRDRGTMQFYVDPAEGHDDYLMSLALAVWAARHEGGTRTARGRAPRRGARASGLVSAQEEVALWAAATSAGPAHRSS